jgi:hypothetical protein
VLRRITILLEELTSNPSVLCAAGSVPLRAFGASPAVLFKTRSSKSRSEQEEMEKRWVGQLRMVRPRMVEWLVTFLTTMKWSGFGTPPLEPRPSQ